MPSIRWQRRLAAHYGSAVGLVTAVSLLWPAGRTLARAAGLQAGATAAVQPGGDPATGSASFTIFLRTVPIGNETVTVERTADGWTITSAGRAAIPLDVSARRVQLRYSPDWKPVDLAIDATIRGQAVSGRTTIDGTTARNVYSQNGQSSDRSDPVAADAVLLPNPAWGPYEALSRRLMTAAAGSTISAYAIGASYEIRVGRSTDETLQMGTQMMKARRTAITVMTPDAPLAAEIWGDEHGRLMRISLPAQGLEIVRDDISSVAVRHVVVARPGDTDLRVQANGFRIAGTVSTPAKSAEERLPAVVLVSGSGPTDRDETLHGIPVFGQLAGRLADLGMLVVRYDKRGVGQSGGRVEAATVEDFADDLRAVVAAVRRLPNVDRRRLAVVGYGEGGLVAMLAASREGDITALALLSSIGVTGAELNMWQVEHALEQSKRTPEERASTIALQTRIQDAVVKGTGWDTIPPQYRRQADTPWFKSFLTFDPAKVLAKVSQPVLIVHALHDREIPPANADRLEELATRRKNAKVVTTRLEGLNHLLVEAPTGEIEEYPALKQQPVSAEAATAIADGLTRLFAGSR